MYQRGFGKEMNEHDSLVSHALNNMTVNELALMAKDEWHYIPKPYDHWDYAMTGIYEYMVHLRKLAGKDTP